MSEWISVKERLPEVDKTSRDFEDVCVIAYDGRFVRVLEYERALVRGKVVRRWKYMTGRIFGDDDSITHWMELPEPPKEDLNEI